MILFRMTKRYLDLGKLYAQWKQVFELLQERFCFWTSSWWLWSMRLFILPALLIKVKAGWMWSRAWTTSQSCWKKEDRRREKGKEIQKQRRKMMLREAQQNNFRVPTFRLKLGKCDDLLDLILIDQVMLINNFSNICLFKSQSYVEVFSKKIHSIVSGLFQSRRRCYQIII